MSKAGSSGSTQCSTKSDLSDKAGRASESICTQQEFEHDAEDWWILYWISLKKHGMMAWSFEQKAGGRRCTEDCVALPQQRNHALQALKRHVSCCTLPISGQLSCWHPKSGTPLGNPSGQENASVQSKLRLSEIPTSVSCKLQSAPPVWKARPSWESPAPLGLAWARRMTCIWVWKLGMTIHLWPSRKKIWDRENDD